MSCWGDGQFGQVGAVVLDRPAGITDVPNLRDAIQIAAGGEHSCAVRASGRVACWGHNHFGQLGNGPPSKELGTPQPNPVAVVRVEDAVEVEAGEVHSCARRRSGAIACWGHNDRGQLGAGIEGTWTTRVPVKDITDAIALSGGVAHICVARSSGAVACWGTNADGQLGREAGGIQRVPVGVGGVDGAREIAAGGSISCARRSAGDVVCWGERDHGALGDGALGFSASPIAVASL